MNKKGVSAVLVTILITTLAIILITIVWSIVGPRVTEDSQIGEYMPKVQIITSKGYTVFDSSEGTASVQFENTGDETSSHVSKLRVSFSSAGDSLTFETPDAPLAGEASTYCFDLTGIPEKPTIVTVVPIFENGEMGNAVSTVSIPDGDLTNFNCDEMVEQPVETKGFCASDGTISGQCSVTEPYFCNGEELVEDCVNCGSCPLGGWICNQTTGKCDSEDGDETPTTSENYCYQESADSASINDGDCGLNYEGNYEDYVGSWENSYPVSNSYDGDWSTYAESMDLISTISITYAKPSDAINTSKWKVKDGFGEVELTIPSECWDSYDDKLHFLVDSQKNTVDMTGTSDSYDTVWYCYGDSYSSNLITLRQNKRTDYSEDYVKIYEEGMKWVIGEVAKAPPLTENLITQCTKIIESGTYTLRDNILDNSSATSDLKGCIDIEADDVHLDCNHKQIVLEGYTPGIYSGMKNTTINNCNIRMTLRTYGSGEEKGNALFLENSDDCNVWNSKFSSNNVAVKIYSSDNCTIKNNTITHGSSSGFYFSGLTNSIIEDNYVYNSYGGYKLYYSSHDNILRNNYAANNAWAGFHIREGSYNNLIENNVATDNYYYGIINYECDNNDFINNTVNNNGYGISVSGNNNKIIGNNASNNQKMGISVNKGSGVIINSNTANNNFDSRNPTYISEGIVVSELSDTLISNNTARGNKYGLAIYSSNGNNITKNNATNALYDLDGWDLYCKNSNGNYGLNNIFNRTYECDDGWPLPEPKAKEWCNYADINRDGYAGGSDYIIWRSHFGENCSKDNRWCDHADINKDMIVNTTDLELLRSEINKNQLCKKVCNLEEVYFTNNISEKMNESFYADKDEVIYLVSEGDGCNGLDVNVSLKERDPFSDDLIKRETKTFANDRVIATWDANYTDDFFTDDEYFFDLSLANSTIGNTLLDENKSVKSINEVYFQGPGFPWFGHGDDEEQAPVYYELCLDEECENSDVSFDITQSPIYLKISNSQYPVNGVLTDPDGFTSELFFSNDVSEIDFQQAGEYMIDLKEDSDMCNYYFDNEEDIIYEDIDISEYSECESVITFEVFDFDDYINQVEGMRDD